jgi:hypothetical protein
LVELVRLVNEKMVERQFLPRVYDNVAKASVYRPAANRKDERESLGGGGMMPPMISMCTLLPE